MSAERPRSRPGQAEASQVFAQAVGVIGGLLGRAGDGEEGPARPQEHRLLASAEFAHLIEKEHDAPGPCLLATPYKVVDLADSSNER